MSEVYLLLGSNMGSRPGFIKEALTELERSCGRIMAESSFYETAAWGKEDQPAFINLVVCIQTTLTPLELLSAIQIIENVAGRQRDQKWGQRTLDIDILLYSEEIIDLPELKIPHPFMQDRRFTLVPLAEIAPELLHPILKKTMLQLLAACPDKLDVKRL